MGMVNRICSMAMLGAALGICLAALLAGLSPGLISQLSSSSLAAPAGDDPALRTMSAGGLTTMKAGESELRVYRKSPAGEGTWPAVVVLPDGWGLTQTFQRALDRMADRGFIVVALDISGGKVARDADKAREMGVLVNQESAIEGAMALVHELKFQREVGDHRVGMLGFGAGAGLALRAAMRSDETSALAAVYPTSTPDAASLRRVACPILAVFGGSDTLSPKTTAEAFRATLEEAGRTADVRIYDGGGHGFMNEDAPEHDTAVAADAWSLVTSFLQDRLQGR